MQFANKTQFIFDLSPNTFPGNVAGAAKYATPAEHMETLGDLARLTYIRARFCGTVRFSAADNGTITVKLTDGITTYASQAVAIAAGTSGRFDLSNVDLSTVRGSANLQVVADVTVATAGAVTVQVFGKLTVEHPLVITG